MKVSKIRLSKVVRDISNTGQIEITFRIPTDQDAEFIEWAREFQNMDLDITLEKAKNTSKRSISANSFLWVLLQKIAAKMGISKEEAYEKALREYGVFELDTHGNIMQIAVPRGKTEPIDAMKKQGFHFMYSPSQSDYEQQVFALLKGTSRYSKSEFRVLLDGVIQDAKDLGIETLTPKELEEILSHIKE